MRNVSGVNMLQAVVLGVIGIGIFNTLVVGMDACTSHKHTSIARNT